MTNVTGDSLGAGIVYHLSKHELPPIEPNKGGDGELAEIAVENPGQRKAPNGTEGPVIAAV